MTQRLLALAGIQEERLHLAWLSSAEAQRFAETAKSVIEAVRACGKLDVSSLRLPLEAAEMTVGSEIIRWLVGKEVHTTAKGDIYGRKWTREQFEAVLDEVLEREYQKNLIYLAIREGCTSVRAIGDRTGLALRRISHLLTDLEKTNRVEFKGMEDKKPVFAAL